MQDAEKYVRRFQKGEPSAFEALFRAEGPQLGRFIRRYVRSQDTAEDIFQEAWLKAWNQRASLREPSKFRSWLYQITRNAIFEELRRRKRRPEINIAGTGREDENHADLVSGIPDLAPDPRATAVKSQLASAIESEIRVLDPQAQEMLALRFGADLGLREIAELLGVPLGTVCAKVSRSLKTIRESLESKGMSWIP